MRAALAPLLLVSLALAGCSGDTHRPPAGNGADPTGTVEPEPDNAVFQVAFQANGTATVEVPFPHLDACVQPEHWLNGTARVSGAVPEMRDASSGRTGRVLALEVPGAGAVEWQGRLDLGAHPKCQPLRFDPWSIDPDAQGEAVEVRVTGDVHGFTVLVRSVRGGCGNATLHEGPAAPGSWSALTGRTIPAGC